VRGKSALLGSVLLACGHGGAAAHHDAGLGAGLDSGLDAGDDAQGDDAGDADAPDAGPGQPFGSHRMPYAPGTIVPSVGQDALDQSTASFYDAWKAAYLVQGCGGYYVATGGMGGGMANNAITVSEAHGYGMVIAALASGHDPDAHAIFDGLYAFFRAHPSKYSADLMAWEQLQGCQSSMDDDSATDGDLDIAYALLLAARLWPGSSIDYAAEAQKVIGASSTHEFNPATKLPSLGDWAMPSDAQFWWGTRPSDFMFDHFRSFAAFTGDPTWSARADAAYALVSTMQSTYAPQTGLVPDFVVSTNTKPAPAPANYLEDTTDGEYAYNACRVPWRIGTDAAVSGEPRAVAALAPIEAWIQSATGGDATKIGTDYALSSGTTTSPGDTSMAFVAPFGVGAMADAANQAWLDAVWSAVVARSLSAENDYYGNTVKLLSMLVMSHNWWGPW
jgi:endo-1,4-beta-D-glucanase Y